ncbi:hypothetical protein QBC38DRAFT_220075 [Podospora fimiseda]|uniref:ubiquitinyl hydrolase 1 n=1 Tax=Podospora fimiseda TaxID=252190 RepID=A0AAN7BNM7_9PEZI|nr:hypothetical protein QBC38DRAFT_220075 [Podospora fimiseda]
MSSLPVQPAGFLPPVLMEAWFDGRQPDQSNNTKRSFVCRDMRDNTKQIETDRHNLIILPGQKSDTHLSCMCAYCRYHFVFFTPPPPATTFNQHHPQHFFCFDHFESESDLAEARANDEWYFADSRTTWKCHCGASVVLEISPPHLKPEWIATIGDEERIAANIRRAKEEDPERFRDVNEVKANYYQQSALTTLNTYLDNILKDSGTGQTKRISVRNKTFTAQFGQDCLHIFEALRFKRLEEDGENYLIPPRPKLYGGLNNVDLNANTPLRTDRAFFQDIKSEVQSVIEKRVTFGSNARKKTPAADLLKERLGCNHVDWPTRTRPGMSNIEEQQCLWTLGAPNNAGDSLLEYAYRQQIIKNPSERKAYLDALSKLASNGGGEDHQQFCFSEHDKLQKTEPPKSKDDMDLQSALAVFGAKEETNADTVANAALVMFNDNPKEALKIIKAVEKVLPYYEERGDPHVQELRTVYQDLQQPTGSSSQSGPSPDSRPPQDGNTPIGLINIRNTCYLNSLFQYMYTVSAIQDFVLGYPDLDLDSTEASVTRFMMRQNIDLKRGSTNRHFRTGEAYLGYVFVYELRNLFQNFQTAQKDRLWSITPSQRLVNAAVIRSDDPNAVKFHEIAKAAKGTSILSPLPPLPPRPNDGEIDDLETSSAVSDKTLVGDTAPTEAETRDRPVPCRNTVEKLAEGVNSTEVKGTAQEDIQEAWLNIKDHLEAAALLIHQQPLTKLFLNTVSEHSRGLETDWKKRQAVEDFINVMPSSREAPDLINAAASTFFDLEALNITTESPRVTFRTLDEPARHVFMLIHRTTGDKKNQGPMNMPQKINLGRFQVGPTVPDWEKKKREWEIKARLNEIKPIRIVREIRKGEEPVDNQHVDELLASLGTGTSTDVNGDGGMATARDLFVKHGIEFSEVSLPDIAHDLPKWVAPHPPGWDNLWDTLDKEEAKQEEELSAEWQKLIESWPGDSYLLHAAFIHMGPTGNAGHYWVYIRDFEQNVWRKYNDSKVTVVQDPVAEIFEHGDPLEDPRRGVYLLAYIKESDVGELVSVPVAIPKPQEDVDDVEMVEPTAEHAEDDKMKNGSSF